MPGGNAVSPPELAGDAPVVELGHPLHVGFAVLVGSEADVAFGDGAGGGLERSIARGVAPI